MHVAQRAGNVFISFNNRNATDVIPLMAPLIAPSARLLGPVLNQIASSPVRSTVEVRSPLPPCSPLAYPNLCPEASPAGLVDTVGIVHQCRLPVCEVMPVC